MLPTKRQADGHSLPSLSTTVDGRPTSPVLQSVAENPGQDDVSSASSNDSGPLWEAVGSLPRSTPALAQFDENEFASFEDGEVADEEDEGPPPNQEANRTRSREDIQRLDEYVGEHRRSLSHSEKEPTARKRSWTGSTLSDEDRRSARRPRLASREGSPLQRLPSIRELVGNPWCGSGGDDGRSFNFLAPVTMSTPLRSAVVRSQSPFYHDPLANVSGHAPTLRGSSIDTHALASPRAPNGSHTSRAASIHDQGGMEVDIDAGNDLLEDGSSLLEQPMTRRHDDGTRGRSSDAIGPWNLRDALSEQEPSSRMRNERDQEAFWRGGYRPRDWDDRGRRPTNTRDDVGRGEEEEASDMDEHSHFSALPNTKAWQYRQALERERSRAPSQSGILGGHETSRYANDVDMEETRRDRAGYPSHDYRAGRSPLAGTEREEEQRALEEETGREVPEPEWWQKVKTQRLPSALMREMDVEDSPVTVSHPHSDRWTVHLSDPEERYVGLSKEWMKSVWMDDKPVVLFSVFNYKFTKNQEVNRHIETNVTTLTTFITGETGFHVVPPDPEWRHELNARDLPSLWVIRGLSEAAAWEMVKAHVISTRAVSIITHRKVMENPRFVCGLAGFLRPDVKTTKDAVLSVLETDYMMGRLRELARSSDRLEHLTIDKRVEKVIESLDIRFMQTKEDGYVANVFMTPPSDDLEEWREWAEEMRSCRYNVFLNGTGAARKAFWCGGCRGVDHEDQECPFTRMKGWKGPVAGARTHSKHWEPETTGGRKPGRSQGGSFRSEGAAYARTPMPGARGYNGRGGNQTFGAGRGRGMQRAAMRGPYDQHGGSAQRGSFTQRGSYDQRGGMRSEWNPRTPNARGAWSARF